MTVGCAFLQQRKKKNIIIFFLEKFLLNEEKIRNIFSFSNRSKKCVSTNKKTFVNEIKRPYFVLLTVKKQYFEGRSKVS